MGLVIDGLRLRLYPSLAYGAPSGRVVELSRKCVALSEVEGSLARGFNFPHQIDGARVLIVYTVRENSSDCFFNPRVWNDALINHWVFYRCVLPWIGFRDRCVS